MRKLKILYVGPDYFGSNGTSWRNAFVELGHEVVTINDELFDPPSNVLGTVLKRLRKRPPERFIAALNELIIKRAREFQPDFTFFTKGYWVLPETLAETRKIGLNIDYVNDDLFRYGATFTFREGLKHMDCVVTTKSFSVREFQGAGARCVIYQPNAYDPAVHFPAQPDANELNYYQGDVAFVGAFTPMKASFLAHVAHETDILLNIWGLNWQKAKRLDNLAHRRQWRSLDRRLKHKSLWGAQMGKAFQSNAVCLGLLSSLARDLHTSRSFEIPACGGFMLAERTEEHRMFFEEDREAAYFDSPNECIDKIRFYIGHEDSRSKIARAGFEKVRRLNATYVDRASEVISQYESLRGQKLMSPGHSVLSAAGD